LYKKALHTEDVYRHRLLGEFTGSRAPKMPRYTHYRRWLRLVKNIEGKEYWGDKILVEMAISY